MAQLTPSSPSLLSLLAYIYWMKSAIPIKYKIMIWGSHTLNGLKIKPKYTWKIAYIQLFSKTFIGNNTRKSPCSRVILRLLTQDRSVKFSHMVAIGVIESVYSTALTYVAWWVSADSIYRDDGIRGMATQQALFIEISTPLPTSAACERLHVQCSWAYLH